MEAFGRGIAVTLGALGLVVSLLFYKTATVRWQKNETVKSMSQAYVDQVLSSGEISCSEWRIFREQLSCLGNYRTEFAVYERRRFEGNNGRIYLFQEWKVSNEDRKLAEGSYIRLVVTEEGKGKEQALFYGNECVVIAGGRAR